MLSSSQKKELRKHRYSSVGSSIMDEYMAGFWNQVIKYVPRGVSANMLTLFGLLNNAIPVLIIMGVYGENSGPLPTWLLAWCATSIFIYQTLDAIDGKQARRLGMASPLGEIFDHGMDAISTFLLIMMTAAVVIPFNLEASLLNLSLMACFGFYFAHWHAFVTGSLYFGRLHVTEAQFMVIILILLPIFIHPQFYHIKLFGYEIAFILIVANIINFIYNYFVLLSRIVNLGAGKNGSSVANTSVISPFIPCFILLFCSFYLINSSQTNVFVDNVYLSMIFFGFAFGKLSLLILVAFITKSPFFPFDICLLPFIAIFINSYFNLNFPELLLFYLATSFIVFDWFRYFYKLCREISEELKIPILLVK